MTDSTPAIGQDFLELIREYAVGMVANNRNMGQLLNCQRKDLSATENRITVSSAIGPVNWASPCGSMCQVLREVKSFLPGPIFVFR